MNPPNPSTGPRLLLGAAALVAALAVVAILVIKPPGQPAPANSAPPPHPEAGRNGEAAATTADPAPAAPSSTTPAKATATALPSTAAITPATPLARTAEGRIAPESLAEFTPQPYPGGPPAYEGEPVTAYVAVPSTGRKVALTVNQAGEYPRLSTAVDEPVEVRLAFTTAAPGTPVAVVALDGGALHTGKLSTALPLDAARQLAFAFTVSPNDGLHRVSATMPGGEVKTLEFWAGPHPVLMRAAAR